MKAKRMLILIVTLALGLMLTSIVSAQDETDEDRPPFGGGFGGVMQIIVEQTGLDMRALMEQLRDGATLSDIITNNGGSVDAVIEAAIAAATERLNMALENGFIDETRASEMLASLETRVTEMVNGQLPGGGRLRDRLNERRENRPGGPLADRLQERRQDRPGSQPFNGIIRDALENSGLEFSDIRERLQNGESIREVLISLNVDVDALVNDALAQAETRLNEAVANNRITTEQAADRLEAMRERFNRLLDFSRNDI